MILKTKAAFSIFFVLCFFCNLALNAQSRIIVRGQVSDTTNVGVPGANVRLLAGKDTLITTTDSIGRFSFSNLTVNTVSLLIRSIGYLPYSKNYVLKEGGAEQKLPSVMLHAESQQLNEVVIKGKVVPMRLMKDTVEFNAAAFTIRENDQLGDLLKQLPGVEVDKDGNVTTEGKEMTKLRVNGKDFFTSNVKDFIAQLPAGIIDKLQVIDDYGDKANFTGVKKGEPQKMLNLVLKPNRNRGKFGNATASAGTNDRYALNLTDNLWEDTRQIGLLANASNTNTGAGVNTISTIGGNYRNKLGKNLTVNGNYMYANNRSQNVQDSYIETVNSLGTIYNQSHSESSNKGNNHNFDLGLQSENQQNNFISGSIRGSLNSTAGDNLSNAIQTGVIRQNLLTQSGSNQSSPNINAEFTIGHKFKKTGRNLSVGITGGNTLSKNKENQNNEIGYFDPESGAAVKDSIRNQLVDTRNRNLNLGTTMSYTEPLGNGGDSSVNRGIDITYDFSLTHTRNKLETSLSDGVGGFKRLDSLSNLYTSSFIKHTLGVNYRYDNEKLNYTIGLSAQPNLLTGAYEGREDKIHHAGLNIAPVARLTYTVSRKNMFIFFYNGNSTTPNFNQLQPVPDTRNLQNVIIGNPDLKTAFNHSLNLNYRHSDRENGSGVMIGIRGNIVQDQVVSNTVLIRDTLNSLKQETRYLNTNGNYNIGSNYIVSIPFQGKKYNLEVKGSLAYDHRISFADQAENLSKGININQGLSMRMNQKWLMLNTNVNYNYKSNVYSLASSRSNTVQIWAFNLDAKAFILKSLTAGLTSVKTINQGFSFAEANPLLLGGFVEKTFFKSRQASLKLQGNDLLNQGNSLSRTVTDNSITESKNNQVTRYFLLSFNWKLQVFGGQG